MSVAHLAIIAPTLEGRDHSRPVGARVSLTAADESLSAMSPDSARSLADGLRRAAEQAEEIDRQALPLLEKFADVMDGLALEDAGGMT